MENSPKTIQIFLPDGDPNGIRISEITTQIVQVIEVPRKQISEFLKMPESDQVALYFLIGGSVGSEQDLVYVGQTTDLKTRLKDHIKKKDFWDKLLVVVTRTNSLTSTHALFLEWHSIRSIREAARYADENGNRGSETHTPAPLKAECMSIFETTTNLLNTLGYPLFSKVPKEETQINGIYYCTGPGIRARGVYTSEGVVVFKGSIGRRGNVASIQGSTSEVFRDKVINSEVILVQKDEIIFQKDHVFRSPSAAALFVLGRSANGWVEWKTESGQTLDEIERNNVDD